MCVRASFRQDSKVIFHCCYLLVFDCGLGTQIQVYVNSIFYPHQAMIPPASQLFWAGNKPFECCLRCKTRTKHYNVLNNHLEPCWNGSLNHVGHRKILMMSHVQVWRARWDKFWKLCSTLQVCFLDIQMVAITVWSVIWEVSEKGKEVLPACQNLMRSHNAWRLVRSLESVEFVKDKVPMMEVVHVIHYPVRYFSTWSNTDFGAWNCLKHAALPLGSSL